MIGAALKCAAVGALLFLHTSHSQQLSPQSSTPAIAPTTTTMEDMTSYAGDVVVVADDSALFVYYENYGISPASYSYSQGSLLIIGGCPAPSPTPVASPSVPSPTCQIASTAAGQSLQTFDVLLAGLPNGNSGTGSVVVWKDTRVDWSQQQVLIARDALSGDNFGYDVALDMNNPHVALIGAPGSDDKGSSSGSAYMFASSPTGKFWTEGQRLVGSTESANCGFGSTVQVMGRQAVVSAPGCCKVFLYEQEKPKPVPPPPPKGCGDDDDNSSSTKVSLKDHFHSFNFHPYEDIHQTKTLQWSEQQILDYSGYCDQSTPSPSPYMSMSYSDGNLVLGFPYYDLSGYVDRGMVLSLNLETFRGDCNSNIFPTMLSFEELFEMKESTIRLWESQYSSFGDKDDRRCPHPPKPTPQCEVSRWSVQQVIQPGLYECSYFGSNVAVCEDLLFVQSSNYEPNDGDYPSNCNNDLQSGYNRDYMDGAVLVYQKQSNGQWALLDTFTGPTNGNTNYGDPLTCAGANGYWGQTPVTTTSSPRPVPDLGPNGPIVTISATLQTTTNQYTQDSTWDCAIIMLGDQFGDGWNGADLVITGPGADQQRYTDSCDDITNPHYIRWCPTDNADCGEVTMEIPGGANIPFHPEIYWGVYMEDTATWVYGDFGTKLTFDWDCTNHDLSLVSGERVLTNSSCDCHCQTSRPTPKPTPREKPIEVKTLPPTIAPSLAPSLAPSPDGNRRLKGGDDGTHRPTVSPPPTLALNPYTNSHWEWLTMSSAPARAWCSGSDDMTRGTMYYIYDKTGTRLLQSGTSCQSTSLACWMILPPDGDYILRIGGALDKDGTFSASFCGYPSEPLPHPSSSPSFFFSPFSH
jgi:hypothetical protein